MGKANGWTSDNWYRAGEQQLHFFPHQKRLVFTAGRRIRAEAEAWGGLAPSPGYRDPVMQPAPTTPGSYVIHDHGPYVTTTWAMSRIAWGTPLKLDAGGEHVLYDGGSGSNRWRRVDRLIPRLTAAKLRRLYKDLYGTTGIHDSNLDGFPDKWVFNDFGPWAIRYYRDGNRNRRLDAGERLMGEMIHTTPVDEAATAIEAKTGDKDLVQLQYSHGCIHIKPIDRVSFLKFGAFKTGNLMVVHGPAEVVPEFLTR